MEDFTQISVDEIDKSLEEIEDYKSLLRLIYKQPISVEMVDKVLNKWEEK